MFNCKTLWIARRLFLIFFRSGAPLITLLTARAPTDHQMPATASTVCTTDAILGGVKNPGYAGHHIVSAMAPSHRAYPSFISAISSRLGLSPKCVQLVMMWFRSHVAAPHIQFLLSR